MLFKNEQKNVQSAQSFWILDDSITTGRSIAQISASLPKHAKKAIIGIVTFKVSHRFHHLVMNNHGGFNPVSEDAIGVSRGRLPLIVVVNKRQKDRKKNDYQNDLCGSHAL